MIVVVDGAGIRGTEDLCRHGVAWYARSLGTNLLDRLRRDPAAVLSEALGDAIDAVTAMHRVTCSVTDPSSPQASVAVLRLAGNCADYLVLGDCYVVAESTPPVVITDAREVGHPKQDRQHTDGCCRFAA